MNRVGKGHVHSAPHAAPRLDSRNAIPESTVRSATSHRFAIIAHERDRRRTLEDIIYSGSRKLSTFKITTVILQLLKTRGFLNASPRYLGGFDGTNRNTLYRHCLHHSIIVRVLILLRQQLWGYSVHARLIEERTCRNKSYGRVRLLFRRRCRQPPPTYALYFSEIAAHFCLRTS